MRLFRQFQLKIPIEPLTHTTHVPCQIRGVVRKVEATQWFAISILIGRPEVGNDLNQFVTGDAVRLMARERRRARHSFQLDRVPQRGPLQGSIGVVYGAGRGDRKNSPFPWLTCRPMPIECLIPGGDEAFKVSVCIAGASKGRRTCQGLFFDNLVVIPSQFDQHKTVFLNG